MILKTKEFKNTCSILLTAINSEGANSTNELLELNTENNILYLNILNSEYYISVKFNLEEEIEKLHAVVNASLFLKLVDSFTSETINLIIKDNYLNLNSNGKYKLPFIYDNQQELKITPITIDNVVSTMNISGNTLNNILCYNSKEISKVAMSEIVQQLYYIDQKGCITFTSGACVNLFSLNQPIKVLLSSKLVKLFKLLKGEDVKFSLGYDALPNSDIVQTKVSFETDNISIYDITPSNDTLLNRFPADKIRETATKNYPVSLNLNKTEFAQAINRLLFFSKKDELCCATFSIGESQKLQISNKDNIEELSIKDATLTDKDLISKSFSLNLKYLQGILDTCTEDYLTLSFGDGSAVTLTRNNIINVIPEMISENNN